MIDRKLLSRRMIRLAAVFALLAALACSLPSPLGRQTAQPTEEAGVTEVSPAEAPLPTVDVSQLPPTAPCIVARRPAPGEELPLDGSVDIYFDQPMDQDSVEEAIRFAPALDVDLLWVDDATLRITPKPGQLERATRYQVEVGQDAASLDGLSMEEPVAVEVQTVGFLEVGEVVPAPNAQEIGPDSTITVFFNRPVVPLVIVEDMPDLPQPLSFEPDIPGEGEWVNTSIYSWTPAAPLAGGESYTVTVKAGLEDQTGGVLQEDYTWQFATLSPGVVSVDPVSNTANVPLDATVEIEFNQPMDRASVQNAFSLVNRDDGQPVSGSFKWDDESRLMTFTPLSLLDLDGDYEASVSADAESASGRGTLGRNVLWNFTTVPPPAVVGTRPANGAQSASVWEGIRITFASPMDSDSVEEHIVSEPALPDSATFYSGYGYGSSGTNWRLNINAFLEPSTTYTITLTPGASDPYGNTIDQPYTFSFTTGPLEPLVQLNTQGVFGVYDANRATELFALYRNVDYLDFTLARLSLEEFGILTGPDSYQTLDSFRPSGDQLVREWRVQSEAALNEATYTRIQVASEQGGTLDPGIYLLIADAPKIRGDIRHFMVVVNANLTYKASFDEAFLWLTDLETGEPISGAAVTVYDEAFHRAAEGSTDADGVLQVTTPHRDTLWDGWYAVVEDGDVFAVTMTDWTSGLQAWDFGVPSQLEYENFSLYLYSDRPLYRPGQEVYFKGILRSKDDVIYSLPSQTRIPVEIYNDQGDKVYGETLPVNEFGTFEGMFTIDKEGTLGYYTIEALVGESSVRLGFQVAEYRKPEFVVNLEPDKDAVLDGETIDVTVDAQFFFGGPVSDAEVTWTVMSGTYYFDYQGPGRYNFTDYDYDLRYSEDYIPGFGEVIADGSGRTGPDGKYTISLPARLDESKTSRRFTFEAVVTDINERSVAGRVEVVVHKGQYYVGVHPDTYIGKADEEQSASLIVVDWDSEPVADQEVTVQPVKREWYSVKEEDEYGRTQWIWSVKETEVGDPITVTTDEKGKASVSYVLPEGGVYKILATVADPEGNENRASAFMWVSSRRFVAWRQTNDNRFDLIADKDTYQPGETAEILIASPFAGEDVQALITVERAGVISHKVVTLDTNSYVYRLPITGQHAPNVYVSVVLVKGVDQSNPVPAFKMGEVKLAVDPVEQTLQVTVTPSKERVGPRDAVTYSIETKDFAGNPVDAEVSLALVDLATLSLANPNSGPIVDHFYGNQGLAVRTGVSLLYLVDRLNQDLFDKGKGGGGGGAEGFFDVRTEFEDTAYWAAQVRTGREGVAQVTVRLPDNLTTWRLDARGVTQDALVGQDEVDIVATKPLLIRPVTPRFFVVNDRATLAAVVNNNTEEVIEATVSLEAQGVTITGDTVRNVTIPAGGRVEVTWPVVVDVQAEWVDLVFGVRGGDYSDASKPPLGDPDYDQKLPVYRYEVPETVGTAGQLTQAGERTEGIVLPPTYEVTQGQVQVNINPSLAAATLDGLYWLEHYPYECTEQVVSRFLPNALTMRILRKFDVSDPELESNLKVQIDIGLQKLYAQQHVDGGWGWFVRSDSNPTVTAYVVQGLLAAQDAGVEVDERVISDGISYLKGQLRSLSNLDSHEKLDRQAYILYVLAKAGEADVSRTVQLYDNREGLQYWARALVAQTLWMIDPDDTRLEAIQSDLVNASILSATGVHWEEEADDLWNWNTDIRSTAIILDTLALLWPDNDLVPNGVRWLMVAREGDHWTTTQETVWALIGLTDWMAVTSELNADYDWEFTFNGRSLASGQASRQTVSETTTITLDITDLLPDEVNRLTFERGGGPGRLYYTAHLTAYLPVSEVDPLSRGIVVSRRYLNEYGTPVTQGYVGDILTVEVTIIAPHNLHFVVLEDYYPAGAEAIDTGLLTESVLSERPTLRPDVAWWRDWWWWSWWWSETDLRDEKAVLYADYLSAGTYQYTYQIRLGLAGNFQVIPPVAWEFYFPEVYGRGEGMLFDIFPAQ